MLLDFLFPRRSLTGGEGEWVTQEELLTLSTAPRIFMQNELRARGLLSLDQVYAMGSYQHSPLLKRALHTLKYKRVPGLAGCLGTVLVHMLQEKFPLCRNAALCPVPLHFLRHFSRGFNQSELLARSISKKTSLPSIMMLRRVRPTGHQAWRGRRERLQVMNDAFRIKKNMTISPHIYLVDDVFTTGATLEECAKVLKRAGAKCVEAIVIAYD